jgi:soluble lytic murein transglycosylase
MQGMKTKIWKLYPPMAAFFISILLLACNLIAQPEVIYVTATPAGTATPQPTITSTPTATVPPTPTIAPEIALQVADNYLTNGYYENAVGTYQTVINQGDFAPQDIRASAAFGLAQAALREGLFTNAVEAMTGFIEKFPDDSRIPQAHFLRGDAYLGLSQWANAITDFQTYLTLRPGLIDSYAYERIGDAQLALEQFDESLNSYALATQASRSLVPQLALREKVAQLYISAGDTEKAIAEYDAILAVAQNAPYRASIEYLAGQALIQGGQGEAGMERLLRVFNQYPDNEYAYRAMNVLTQNGRELDDFARGKVAFTFGDFELAIEAFDRYTTTHTLAEVPAELHLLLGRAYREIGNNDAAVVAFQTIIDQYPQDDLFGQALLEQGRTRFLAGDIPGAIQRYQFIADNYDYLPEAAEALWRVGYLYGTNDNPQESQRVFEELAQRYPNTEQARSGLSLAASAAYNAGDTTGAERLFAQLATTSTGDDQASAYLWVGRLALARGDNNTANAAFERSIAAAPDGYFSARAQDLLQGKDPFIPPVNYQFEFDEAAQINEAETWLREKFGITQEGQLWPLSPELEADPRLIRGKELWAVAAYAEAETEFYDILNNNQQNGLVSYQMAVFLRGLGAYEASITGAANVIRAAGVGTLDAPPFIARMRYPAYYLDVVREVAQRREFDPLLMFSLIRHESLFDTNATAAAGEKGLTQVIPGTGEYIASELQWPDYQHSDLFRPYAGIEFGAFYLDEQLERFDGNVYAALAGYNAGPGRALNWLELSGGDPDLFMNTISIDSTRLYVQRIYSYYNIYRALYGA